MEAIEFRTVIHNVQVSVPPTVSLSVAVIISM